MTVQHIPLWMNGAQNQCFMVFSIMLTVMVSVVVTLIIDSYQMLNGIYRGHMDVMVDQ
jgi:hypothetical protein